MAPGSAADGGRPENEWIRGDDELPLDFVLELLSNAHRREILRRLRDSPGQVHSLDEIVDQIVRLERETAGSVPGKDHILSVIIHIHGPKLQEADLVDYDVRSREIRYKPNEAVERVLEVLDEVAAEL